jgi:methionyl aminopeptidase
MKDFYAFNNVKIKNDKARNLFNHINKNYSTLAFCRRWLEEDGATSHLLPLKYLVDNGFVNPYPPLSDIKGCYTAQFEHTFMLKPTSKEIISIGDDY